MPLQQTYPLLQSTHGADLDVGTVKKRFFFPLPRLIRFTTIVRNHNTVF